ncbi:hypothetical protein HPB47_017692 [Ixodes persulcatus]|uniref:Uncharacterized protein n=1 Tax=Ixodes persulcatus TaxID=34615 RepID=A0AC60QPN9_IXOPE|nr:hypothetical protein HPB47_017692 [Ixodes persulcatus]
MGSKVSLLSNIRPRNLCSGSCPDDRGIESDAAVRIWDVKRCSLPCHVLLIRGRTGGVGNVNSFHCIPNLGSRFASSDMVGDLSHEFPATARPRRRRLRRGPPPREWNDGLAPHLEKNHWHKAAGQPEVVPELTEVAVCSQRYLGHPASPQVVSGPERGLPSPQERTEWPWIPYVVQGPCAPRRRPLQLAQATEPSQTSATWSLLPHFAHVSLPRQLRDP